MASVLSRSEVLGGRHSSPPPHLSINTSQRGTPASVPNKHIPYCSPGPQPAAQLETPPASPPASELIETTSLTFPPKAYKKISHDPAVYGISAAKLTAALDHLATQPLPSPKQVFPWLHGLHSENQLQLAFFIARKKSLRRTPKCIRGITIVKTGGDLLHSKLKGAIAPEEILRACNITACESCKDCEEFHDIDPRDGFSVRNFQIQACKMASVSDIIVYRDDKTSVEDMMKLARRISKAQAALQDRLELPKSGEHERQFNTFVLTDRYAVVECDHPDVIALDSAGNMTGKVMDFFHWERVEMCSMAIPTEIATNVWLGPTPDLDLVGFVDPSITNVSKFDLMIEASDAAQVPDPKAFAILEEMLYRKTNTRLGKATIPQIEFPGSGSILPPTWSQAEVDGLIETCVWMHGLANGSAEERKRRDSKLSVSSIDRDGDSMMQSGDSDVVEDGLSSGRKILIHCTDGYTESSLLALAYFMYAECLPVHEAWIQLHCGKRRNFFAYPSDVALLKAIQPRLLQSSPKHTGGIQSLCLQPPSWLANMDGSLPSRILPYMYLGNLGHANNPGLLHELGIGQVLSIGEVVTWSGDAQRKWPDINLLYVDKIQDNGVDPLTEDFGRCLEYIERGRNNGTATLVHCRVGVSRSATICIAEVMNELGLSFPRAYCFVRARRLNVIIQPHLRFSYELLKWEEYQCEKRNKPLRRELEWASISREIAAMNRPYSRQS